MSPIVEDIARRLLGSEVPQKITVQAEEPESEEIRYLSHLRSPFCAFHLLEREMDGPNDVTRAFALWSHLGGRERGSVTRRTENGEVFYDFSVDDWEITDLNPNHQIRSGPLFHDDWLVFTEEEADVWARDNLRESIQYAHSSFLAANMDYPKWRLRPS